MSRIKHGNHFVKLKCHFLWQAHYCGPCSTEYYGIVLEYYFEALELE